jgi:hypothetical protein
LRSADTVLRRVQKNIAVLNVPSDVGGGEVDFLERKKNQPAE